MNKRQAKKKRKKNKMQFVFSMSPEDIDEYLKSKVRVVYTPRQMIVGTFTNTHWMKEYFQYKSVIPPVVHGWMTDKTYFDEDAFVGMMERIEDENNRQTTSQDVQL